MKNTRRQFIKSIGIGMIGSGVILGTSTLGLAGDSPPNDGFEVQKGFKIFNDITQKNMEKLAEVLVPGSKGTKIKSKMMDYLQKHKEIATFLDAGLWNLDSLSRKVYNIPFFSLTKQEDIDRLIRNEIRNNRSFYTEFRQLVIVLYYADPMVWKKLSYNGPPQPKGFLDYSEPPKGGKTKG